MMRGPRQQEEILAGAHPAVMIATAKQLTSVCLGPGQRLVAHSVYQKWLDSFQKQDK